MMNSSLKFVICGLSITSSWGNGHATTYRGLVRGLTDLGHEVLFLERDRPWYAENRDLSHPPYGRTELYASVEDLKDRFTREIAQADVVIVGSYVPDGIEVAQWVNSHAKGLRAFYDIDTPVTLALLADRKCQYLAPALIPQFHLYLSFTGGPVLRFIEEAFRSPKARPLYCSVDTRQYYPESHDWEWDLGYIGTYSSDRQPTLERLLIEPARAWTEGRFIVAGPMYPENTAWAPNIRRIPHIAPHAHRAFYNQQRYTLNVTRKDMIQTGFSPSVRLFEAAACGTPILSDNWPGLDSFFTPDKEILLVRDSEQVIRLLRGMPEEERIRIGNSARAQVLARHTSEHRSQELIALAREGLNELVRASTTKPGESRRKRWLLKHETTLLNR